MSKLRSVSTGFWSDPFIEDLSPDEKLLFLYLITNEKTNMLGIYEASIKKISFETGLKKETVLNGLKAFERVGKVKYEKNFVILVNYMKHQNFNTNMKKSAIDCYNNLPNELKNSKISVSKDNPLKGFESLLNHFGMVRKIEREYEYELEVEKESKLEEKKREDFFNIDEKTDFLKSFDNKMKIIKYLKIKNVHISGEKFNELHEQFKLKLIAEDDFYKPKGEIQKHFTNWMSYELEKEKKTKTPSVEDEFAWAKPKNKGGVK